MPPVQNMFRHPTSLHLLQQPVRATVRAQTQMGSKCMLSQYGMLLASRFHCKGSSPEQHLHVYPCMSTQPHHSFYSQQIMHAQAPRSEHGTTCMVHDGHALFSAPAYLLNTLSTIKVPECHSIWRRDNCIASFGELADESRVQQLGGGSSKGSSQKVHNAPRPDRLGRAEVIEGHLAVRSTIEAWI